MYELSSQPFSFRFFLNQKKQILLFDFDLNILKGGGVSHKVSEREKSRNNCDLVNNDSRKDNLEYERIRSS